MYMDIPEYHELLLEVRANLLRISQGFELEYSKEDYDRASYFILGSLRLVDSVYEDEPEALYVRRCTRCNVYIDQKQDLIIKKKTFRPKMVAMAWEEELIVSPDVKSLIEKNGWEHVEFRPVFNKVKKTSPIANQLIVTHILPPIHDKTELNRVAPCPSCHFKSFRLTREHAIYYAQEEIDQFADFNRTFEYFGSGFFPRPYVIVSKKVRDCFLKHQMKDATFEPIFFC